MDRCLKDKAHFIIAQTIWNNKNGKAVFAEQVFDRCQRKFQDEINRELYKLIEEGGGGGGGTGKDGKTPVLKAGEITSLPYGAEPTFKLVYEGNNHEGNPVYRMDLGLPQGKPGEDGGADGKTPVMQIGNVTTVDAGGDATANVRQDGTDVSDNPIYKIDFGIPRGANGDDGNDGKTPVFETGTITTLEPDQPATCTITKTGDNPQGNPIYRVDVGIPKGNTGEPGDTPSLDGYATETWVTTQITNTVGIINASLDNINGEIV